jgi:hypothetical protein
VSTFGIPNSATYAQSLSGIDEMMNVLPDNLDNQISAQRVRNVVYTLYDDIQNATSVEFLYSNPDEISNPIGNWVKGVNGWGGTFSNVTLQQLFNGIFYRDSGPRGKISFNGLVPQANGAYIYDFKGLGTTEYPSNSDLDQNVSFRLSWEAIKGTYNLNQSGTITRNPTRTPPDPNPLINISIPLLGNNGAPLLTNTYNAIVNTTNTFRLNFTDIKGGTPPTTTTTLSYAHRAYWGRRPNNSIPTSEEIRGLDGAGVSQINNNTFTNGSFMNIVFNNTTEKLTFNGIDGAGQFLVFAFPKSFGLARFNTPFATNFARVEEIVYRNPFGYEENYYVYISYQPSNSPYGRFFLT